MARFLPAGMYAYKVSSGVAVVWRYWEDGSAITADEKPIIGNRWAFGYIEWAKLVDAVKDPDDNPWVRAWDAACDWGYHTKRDAVAALLRREERVRDYVGRA